MKKVIKVKASIRNGKKVRAHIRTINTDKSYSNEGRELKTALSKKITGPPREEDRKILKAQEYGVYKPGMSAKIAGYLADKEESNRPPSYTHHKKKKPRRKKYSRPPF